MYTLLFADDEEIIREGMRCCIDWDALDIQWLDAARNGREAWEKIRTFQPDIVILDVKMPGMTGLDVIREAQQLENRPEFIIYSGYNEFEFAREAMRYGVRHYLLKPLDTQQLIEVLQNITRTLSGEAPEEVPSTGRSLEKRIKQYVIAHIDDPDLSLKRISAQELFMNPKYVSKAFYKKTGMHFRQYLLEVRVEMAKKLLRSKEDEPVYEVASMVGMGDNPQYFSQVFRKQTGCTPSEYRRRFTLGEEPETQDKTVP